MLSDCVIRPGSEAIPTSLFGEEQRSLFTGMAIIWVSLIDSWCEDVDACCSLSGNVESFQEKFTFQGQLWNLLSIAAQVSLPLGLDFVPTKYQPSKAGSPGGSDRSCSRDWVGSMALSSQDAGRHFPSLSFPGSKVLRAPEAVAPGAWRCQLGK